MDNKDFKILIVDDVPTNIQVLGSILRNESFQIAFASSGKEALSLVKTQRVDLILLDIMMPEMDGFEVCEILKQNPETEDISIVFLTAKVEKENIVRGFELGGQDYITKPFNPAELLARVHTQLKLLNQRKQLEKMNDLLEKKVEERTKQLVSANKKLLLLENAKSNFLNIISHQIRTPLTGIVGFSDLLMESLENEEHKSYMKVIQASSDKLIKFSETALLITSLSAEKYNVKIIPTFVNQVINQSIVRIQKLKEKKNIKTTVNLQSDELKFTVDNELITKCFENILENAVQHSPENGEIVINGKIDNFKITIEFIDQGNGFNQDIIESYSLNNPNDNLLEKQNVGLGLAASKYILKAHNANITLYNNEEKGACVKLFFPYF